MNTETEIQRLTNLLAESRAANQRLTADLDKMFDHDLTSAALREQEEEILTLRKLVVVGYQMAENLAVESGKFLTDEFRKPFEIVARQLKEQNGDPTSILPTQH